MTVVAVEQLQTRSYAFSGGSTTGSRLFTIYDDATTIDNPQTIVDLFGSNGIPYRGEPFPSISNLFAKAYRIEKRAGTDMWDVTWEYASGAPLEKDPAEEGYVEVSLDFQSAFEDFYRSNAAIPTDGTVTATTDIGGGRMDIVGSPLSMLRFKVDWSVTETVDYATFVDLLYPAIVNAQGTRNDKAFQGTFKGLMVYRGASARRIGLGLWSITHSMQQDGEYHLIQTPRRNANGDIDTKLYTEPYAQAVDVYYKQPFPIFSDFSSISPNWS